MPATLKGGDKLDRTLKDIQRQVARSKNRVLQVGFLEGATYPDGTPVASVALWNEFGTPNARHPIPPRPFFRNAIAKNKDKWGRSFATVLKAAYYDVELAYQRMGVGIVGDIQQSIIDLFDPPISQVTVLMRALRTQGITGLAALGQAIRMVQSGINIGQAAKGISTKPLIDTGHMLNSVDYQVRNK